MASSAYKYEIALQLLLRSSLRQIYALLHQYGSAEEAWAHLDKPGMDECWRKAEQEIAWIEDHRIRVWTQSDEDYPYRLKQCPDRPFLLFGKGNMDLSEGHMVSIVGTRRPTPYGMEMTEKLVRELHERLDKLTIVSGGAYGIDICAHRAAIKYGVPTIIVPAHGLDRIYPSVHRPEAIASMEKGGLLTEFMSGTEPIAPHFVQRNRIVAGLADAVVVVESKEKGGSLITASMACDYDRELFAFPGRPTDQLASGCNKLIRDNKAQLITSADDLILAMKWDEDNHRSPIQTRMVELMDDLTPNQQIIMQLLQTAEEGMHINLIVMETQMSYGDVAAEMLMLEVQGAVKAYPGGIYRVVR